MIMFFNGFMKTIIIAYLLLILILQKNYIAAWPGEDKLEGKECEKKQKMGDCEAKETRLFMRENCPASCRAPYAKGIAFVDPSKDETTFFDLEARDIMGRNIRFDRFDGMVTVVIAESSLCLFRAKEYNELRRLQKAYEYLIEIVFFPTQEGSGDAKSCLASEEIKKTIGLSSLTMEAVHINGPNTHPVYKYLKEKHAFDDLASNYATYFVVTPRGHVQIHEDVTPLFLISAIQDAVERDL